MKDRADSIHARKAQAPYFWGEVAPCDHLVQMYDDDDVFLDSLEGFVAGGIKSGDGVIVIATDAHIKALERRLAIQAIDVEAARGKRQYVDMEANAALENFMVGDWPDEVRFRKFVHDTLQRAGSDGRRVRAFGEMVAVLWAQGKNGATVRLEHLWQKICHEEEFALFCAYPKSGFTKDMHQSIAEICAAHSRVLS